MKPGPELDALVAEKVMGCSVVLSDLTGSKVCGCDIKVCGVDIRPHSGGWFGVAPYSTSIEAAWEVAEKVRIGVLLDWEEPGEYHATDKPMCHSEGCGPKCATAATAPHAICLAALKAVEK